MLMNDEGDSSTTEQADQLDGSGLGDALTEERANEETAPEELSEEAALVESYRRHAQQIQADFENYRRRALRVQEEAVRSGQAVLVESLLPALDAFALASAARVSSSSEGLPGDDEWRSSLLSSVALLEADLAKVGLVRVGEVGEPFNVEIHEAVSHSPAGDGDSGMVVEAVLRPGWVWAGRTLRPAMVAVRG